MNKPQSKEELNILLENYKTAITTTAGDTLTQEENINDTTQAILSLIDQQCREAYKKATLVDSGIERINNE